jgi:hypothetical protein
MACGNNNVSRSCLSSQPSGQGARDSVAKRLAAGSARTKGAANNFKGYRSVRMSEAQVKAAAKKRLAEAQASPKSRRYPKAPTRGEEQDHYSKNELPNQVHQYISADGDITFGRAHVHVIHDEINDEVRLHVSLGKEKRHSEKIALVGATGREVEAAIDQLTGALKARMG